MMLRALGAICVVLCGVMSAYTLNSSAKSTLAQVEGLISFLRFLRSEIECFSMPVPRALERCPRQILVCCGCEGELDDISALSNIVTDAQSRAAMVRFCSEIGKGYRDEQLALCDYYIALLEERRAQIGGALPGRKKVNAALCLSGALALVIIFV